MKVVLSREAENDLAAIAEWIAADNPAAARRFIGQLRQTCASLAANPRAFPLAPRFEQLGVRRRVHGNYLILYRIQGRNVVIVHVVNGARDYEGLL